jgi:hypothetical protein
MDGIVSTRLEAESRRSSIVATLSNVLAAPLPSASSGSDSSRGRPASLVTSNHFLVRSRFAPSAYLTPSLPSARRRYHNPRVKVHMGSSRHVLRGGPRASGTVTHDVTPIHGVGFSTRPKSSLLNRDAAANGQESLHDIFGLNIRPVTVVAERAAPGLSEREHRRLFHPRRRRRASADPPRQGGRPAGS